MIFLAASPSSPPLPVWVMNPPDRDFWTFFWVVVAGVGAIAAVIVGVIAARAALVDLWVTRTTLARRSALRCDIRGVKLIPGPVGLVYSYAVGFNVVNTGNRGLGDFRVKIYFSPGCTISKVDTIFKSSIGGPHDIDGSRWFAAEIIAGPIYADDDIWVGTVELVASPDQYRICWVIKSEDARAPEQGFSAKELLLLPAPPAS